MGAGGAEANNFGEESQASSGKSESETCGGARGAALVEGGRVDEKRRERKGRRVGEGKSEQGR